MEPLCLVTIWSDGDYQGGLIRHRESDTITVDIDPEVIAGGECMVEGTVLLPCAVLGCAI